VFMAVWFITIVLVGFVPDSLDKVAAVRAGTRPPLPLAMHVHAVLMGSFMLLLLAQTGLAATGRIDRHRSLGRVGLVLVPALIVAGFVLAASNYHMALELSQSGPPALRERMATRVLHLDNILLLQLRIGLLFGLFIWVGLRARGRDAGLHKRMMFLATAATLPAAIDRMGWLPTTLPASPLTTDLYVLLAVAPLFLWDIFRNRAVHRAWRTWLPVYAVASVAVILLWDAPAWHRAAHAIMGA